MFRSSVRPFFAAAVAAASLCAGPALAGDPVSFPGARIATFKDPDCFDRSGEVATASLKNPTRESPAGAACVKIRDGAATYYVLPSAIKPPAGCGPARKVAGGPQATTYGSQGASACPRG
jgi:hypothetical protein